MPCNEILARNRDWVERMTAENADYFRDLAREHKPEFLFIGCSDARVPANVITQTEAGEMFVHRNIANQVAPSDANMLAVVQYAVEVLGVRDAIVCGHYGCGGVKAALGDAAPPFVENWLGNLRLIRRLYDAELAALPSDEARHRRLVELNVAEQVRALSRTTVVQQAWAAGRTLRLHGWVYDLSEGLLRPQLTLDAKEPAGAGGTPELSTWRQALREEAGVV
jgi:carbonic anhydrase